MPPAYPNPFLKLRSLLLPPRTLSSVLAGEVAPSWDSCAHKVRGSGSHLLLAAESPPGAGLVLAVRAVPVHCVCRQGMSGSGQKSMADLDAHGGSSAEPKPFDGIGASPRRLSVAVALAMGSHARLGAGSPLRVLGGNCRDVIGHILAQIPIAVPDDVETLADALDIARHLTSSGDVTLLIRAGEHTVGARRGEVAAHGVPGARVGHTVLHVHGWRRAHRDEVAPDEDGRAPHPRSGIGAHGGGSTRRVVIVGEEGARLKGQLVLCAGTAGSLRNLVLQDAGDCCVRMEGDADWTFEGCQFMCAAQRSAAPRPLSAAVRCESAGRDRTCPPCLAIPSATAHSPFHPRPFPPKTRRGAHTPPLQLRACDGAARGGPGVRAARSLRAGRRGARRRCVGLPRVRLASGRLVRRKLVFFSLRVSGVVFSSFSLAASLLLIPPQPRRLSPGAQERGLAKHACFGIFVNGRANLHAHGCEVSASGRSISSHSVIFQRCSPRWAAIPSAGLQPSRRPSTRAEQALTSEPCHAAPAAPPAAQVRFCSEAALFIGGAARARLSSCCLAQCRTLFLSGTGCGAELRLAGCKLAPAPGGKVWADEDRPAQLQISERARGPGWRARDLAEGQEGADESSGCESSDDEFAAARCIACMQPATTCDCAC